MFMTATPVAAALPLASTIRSTACRDEAQRLADTLIALTAGRGSVRAMEALAAVVVRSDLGQVSANAAVSASARADAAMVEPRLATAAERIARRALAGVIDDPTRGATRFHRLGELPDWARNAQPVAEIGGFMFYRLSPSGLPLAAESCYTVNDDEEPFDFEADCTSPY